MYQARRTLEKYGWKEGNESNKVHTAWHNIRIPGKGLGKNEAGIARSIKVPLKADTSGVCSMYVSSLLHHNCSPFRLGSILGKSSLTIGGQSSLTKQQKASLWNKARYYGIVYMWYLFICFIICKKELLYIQSVCFGRTLIL